MPERLFFPDSSDSVRCCRDYLYQRFPTAIYEKSLAPNGHKGKGNQMKIIKYEVNGKQIDIEVTEEFARKYARIETEEKRINRKETRRHQSLNTLIEGGFQMADINGDIEEKALRKEDIIQFRNALKTLTTDQKWLIKQIFYYGRKQCEIARELRIDVTSVRDRLRVVYKKIRKNFNN